MAAPTIIIEGDALRSLLHSIKHRQEAGIPVYKVSLDQRADGVAVKVNEAMWTGTLPTIPPVDVPLPFANL